MAHAIGRTKTFTRSHLIDVFEGGCVTAIIGQMNKLYSQLCVANFWLLLPRACICLCVYFIHFGTSNRIWFIYKMDVIVNHNLTRSHSLAAIKNREKTSQKQIRTVIAIEKKILPNYKSEMLSGSEEALQKRLSGKYKAFIHIKREFRVCFVLLPYHCDARTCAQSNGFKAEEQCSFSMCI